MAVTFPPYPIPVIVEENKKGYVLYIESSGIFENDVWTVIHCEDGIVRHYRTNQVRVQYNATMGITIV